MRPNAKVLLYLFFLLIHACMNAQEIREIFHPALTMNIAPESYKNDIYGFNANVSFSGCEKHRCIGYEYFLNSKILNFGYGIRFNNNRPNHLFNFTLIDFNLGFTQSSFYNIEPIINLSLIDYNMTSLTRINSRWLEISAGLLKEFNLSKFSIIPSLILSTGCSSIQPGKLYYPGLKEYSEETFTSAKIGLKPELKLSLYDRSLNPLSSNVLSLNCQSAFGLLITKPLLLSALYRISLDYTVSTYYQIKGVDTGDCDILRTNWICSLSFERNNIDIDSYYDFNHKFSLNFFYFFNL